MALIYKLGGMTQPEPDFDCYEGSGRQLRHNACDGKYLMWEPCHP